MCFRMSYVLVRMFMGEEDMLEGRPAFRRLVELLKEHGVVGATVLRSIMGYGSSGQYHYEGIEVLSYNLPLVVEFVEEKTRALQVLETLLPELRVSLVTLQEVSLCSF